MSSPSISTNHPLILSARRTPIGKFGGSLSRVPSPQLGAFAIAAAVDDVKGAREHGFDECVMGCVLQAGLGQNPARQAGLKAGLPDTLSAVTVNKVCGSGLQAVMQAATSIRAGMANLIVAGGMENMDLAPHFAHVRAGVKFGKTDFQDHMEFDGLRCPFETWGMGLAAEHIASSHGISRADQDAFSAQSHARAAKATAEGWFKKEIVALTAEQIKQKAGLENDEGFRADTTPEVLAKLRPSFKPDGTVTAGNASQISDGAAALVVASEAAAAQLGARALAKIVCFNTVGVAPKEIFFAPKLGMEKILKDNGLTVADIDLFELNEAFAAQVLCNIHPLGIPQEKLNIGGGGVALGHPIGASGARVLVTLVHALHRTGGKRGICSLCLGGGNAVTMLVETC
ncbi:MAG: thiolase family protein [Planctomycetota bacterium]|nr:thiolase family protein [Planctomycetota bacterium]